MKMNHNLLTAVLLGSMGIFRQCKKNAGDLIRFQTAATFLKGVDILRDLFMYQIGLQVCVVFLVFGVILMQGGLIFYLPLNPQSRAITALIIGAVDSLSAFSLLAYFASSRRWLRRAAKYNHSIEELLDGGEWRVRHGGRRRSGENPLASRFSS